jgi:hypothetical protein
VSSSSFSHESFLQRGAAGSPRERKDECSDLLELGNVAPAEVLDRVSRRKLTPQTDLQIASLWSVQGSNLRPPGCKPGALPAELTPLDAKYRWTDRPPTTREIENHWEVARFDRSLNRSSELIARRSLAAATRRLPLRETIAPTFCRCENCTANQPDRDSGARWYHPPIVRRRLEGLSMSRTGSSACRMRVNVEYDHAVVFCLHGVCPPSRCTTRSCPPERRLPFRRQIDHQRDLAVAVIVRMMPKQSPCVIA